MKPEELRPHERASEVASLHLWLIWRAGSCPPARNPYRIATDAERRERCGWGAERTLRKLGGLGSMW